MFPLSFWKVEIVCGKVHMVVSYCIIFLEFFETTPDLERVRRRFFLLPVVMTGCVDNLRDYERIQWREWLFESSFVGHVIYWPVISFLNTKWHPFNLCNVVENLASNIGELYSDAKQYREKLPVFFCWSCWLTYPGCFSIIAIIGHRALKWLYNSLSRTLKWMVSSFFVHQKCFVRFATGAIIEKYGICIGIVRRSR